MDRPDHREVTLQKRILTGWGRGYVYICMYVHIFTHTYISQMSTGCIKGRVHIFFIRELDVPPLGES